ncbi:MAG: hypothetical protein IKD85_04255 [Firmicutes bacterium]|nr:hypothetical protein [Bacillota bacterium]
MKTEKENAKGKGKPAPSPASIHRRWTLSIIVCAFFLSVFMSLFSDLLLQKSSTLVAFIILILIVLIGIVFDIIGVAVTVADPVPFNSMAAHRVKGAKSSLMLMRNASRVSNFLNDVIGDTCGIISGASGAFIVSQITADGVLDYAVVSVVLSGIVASLTIGGKAFGKDIAIRNAKRIVGRIGKILAVFLER